MFFNQKYDYSDPPEAPQRWERTYKCVTSQHFQPLLAQMYTT